MLADMKGMVMKTWHEHYALLAINCMNLEGVHTATRAAEKNRASIIPNLYQEHLTHFPTPIMAIVTKTLAESVSVPVTLALSYDKNLNCIRQTFCAGFGGLMIDVSALPLKENVRQTGAVVGLATSVQFCVEGELGHLADASRYNQATNADLMMQPTDVELFIAQTGIDLLVISVNTAHDMYASGVVPAISFQRLTEIFHYSNMPLVLHGGSGAPFDQLQLYTTPEVAKINVGAATLGRGRSAFLHTLCHDISIKLVGVLKTMELAFEEAITPYLQASGVIGKA